MRNTQWAMLWIFEYKEKNIEQHGVKIEIKSDIRTSSRRFKKIYVIKGTKIPSNTQNNLKLMRFTRSNRIPCKICQEHCFDHQNGEFVIFSFG